MAAIVFGSINMDLVARAPRLPIPGETVIGDNFVTIPGGKGANQAVATARLAVPTEMVGRVGDDDFGRSLLEGLKAAGVGCDRIFMDDVAHSGVAIIAVDNTAENHIIIIPGANGEVSAGDVDDLKPILSPGDVLLLQLEIPLAAVMAAAEAAHRIGTLVLLDPAPVRSELPLDLYPLVDILTPNQVEAGQLVGFPVTTIDLAAKAANTLCQQGVKTVIVKLGAKGVFCATEGDRFHRPAFPVRAVDTVAAGDAFNGGLVAALTEGLPLRQAVTWGTANAAIAVTRAGAQSSMPNREELLAFLQEHDGRP